MEYPFGVGLAVAVCVFAMVAGFDREPVFYLTMGKETAGENVERKAEAGPPYRGTGIRMNR